MSYAIAITITIGVLILFKGKKETTEPIVRHYRLDEATIRAIRRHERRHHL